MSTKGTIPEGRPVYGKDLDMLRLHLGLLVGEACYLFSLSMTRWMHIVRQESELPIKDSSLALLVRLYDQHPELCPIPKSPAPDELFEFLSAVRGALGQREFGALFGAESSSAYRWLKKGGPPSPYVNRLMTGLKRLMLSVPEYERSAVLDEWVRCVTAEGLARGTVKSPMVTGKWNNAGVLEMREALVKQGASGAKVKKKGLAASSAQTKVQTPG
ncbi:MAG TPA: hypothetical protein DCP03_13715 [Polaromonas sp.]|uniref:hypothetical protein n=1 Tax=Polaromonas sp. UBA4122 TaxID=1947074 RepID=UPI000EB94367|nr:hypothetical protein [Polaromonas sp. UBA4122]HAL39097.1 hypothetical protein [Polaromonas sp.]